MIRFGFVDAHVPLTLYYVSTRVDVPSQQRNCLKLVIFVAEVHHGFDEIISNGGRAEPTKVEFESISFGAERPTEPHLILSGGRAEI